jgi:hypothetical protein
MRLTEQPDVPFYKTSVALLSLAIIVNMYLGLREGSIHVLFSFISGMIVGLDFFMLWKLRTDQKNRREWNEVVSVLHQEVYDFEKEKRSQAQNEPAPIQRQDLREFN